MEAFARGDITRLLINMPPRNMKSLEVCVFTPGWSWLRWPTLQWLFASYAENLSIRDSLKTRRIIESPKYRALLNVLWQDPSYREQIEVELEDRPEPWGIFSDQNTKRKYENEMGGYRLSTSVGGTATGDGGDRIVVDDGLKADEATSETTRANYIDWWDETMSTRLNDPVTGGYCIVMQRLHEEDCTGHVLAKNNEQWEHLCLPARYEGANRIFTSLKWTDPRTKIGEPLWPSRFPKKALDRIEANMSEYAVAGQQQQRPAPKEGGMFKIGKFGVVLGLDPGTVLRTVRYWDKAGTEGAGAATAGVRMHLLKDGSYVISDVLVGHWSYSKREKYIKECAKIDNLAFPQPGKSKPVEIWTEQEPGSGGKESAERTVKNLAGYRVKADRVTGDKVYRAQPYSDQVEIGNVKLVKAPWNVTFLENHRLFPNCKLKDEIDASAGAFAKLTNAKRAGTW